MEAASTSIEDMDPEEDRVKSAEDNVKVAEIWREMILTSNGRDKSFVGLFVPPCFVHPVAHSTCKEIDTILDPALLVLPYRSND